MVAHDSGPLLIECVERLVAAGVGEVIVVDNASTDGVPQALAARGWPLPFTLVARSDNPGFATACNVGAAQAAGCWFAFVNPDCLVEPDSLLRLLSFAKRCPSVGLVGCDVRDAHGVREAAARRRDPSVGRVLCEALIPARWRGRRGLYLDAAAAGTVHAVDAVSGALMLVPRAMFEVIGGFDPEYRLHAEDLDLCRRIREAGGLVLIAEDVAVTHIKGTSSAARPLFVAWHKHRGLIRYFSKFGRGTRFDALAVRALVAGAFVLRLPRYLAAELIARRRYRRVSADQRASGL